MMPSVEKTRYELVIELEAQRFSIIKCDMGLNKQNSDDHLMRLAEPFAVASVVVLLLVTGFVTFHNTRRLRSHTDLVEQSHELLSTLERLESTVKSAESGQRGYAITNDESHLEPYREAVRVANSLLTQLKSLMADEPEKHADLLILETLIDDKLGQLETSITVQQTQGLETVRSAIATNFGKRTMDEIHKIVERLRQTEQQIIGERELTAATTYWTALATGLLSTVAGLLLVTGVLYLIQKNRRRAELAAQVIEAERDQLRQSIDRAQRLENENKRMDQYMRNFLEQIEDYAIFAMDAECRATTWNRGVLNVLGFDEEDFLNQDIRELIFTPEAIALGIPEAEFGMAAGRGKASDDRWMMRKGGARFWASGISSAIRSESGEVIGFSKVMRDLTQRKRDQDELAELAARLSEADRRKNEFLATLAHELRNPLAPIKNAVQLMGMTELSDELEEVRSTMARQVEQLICLIDDLLDVSRIGRGKIQLRKSVVDLRDVIHAAVEASNTFVKEKNQHLHVQLCKDSAIALVDPARMTQIVSNLLNNASRYSDSGSHIDLTLAVDQLDGQAGWGVIAVRDNGIGIAGDRMEEIFQMFSQVHDSLDRGSAGLGIGLTLVKTLIEIHGGSVQAQSDGIGMGSVFTVRVPLSSATVAEHMGLLSSSGTTEQSEGSESAEAEVTRPFRVLVVEDLRALRTIMARLLVKLGHQVEVAEDGITALEKLNDFEPQIIFSDISMPGMTGYDLARKLREQPKTAQIYLVAMTGYGQSSDREEAKNSGFDEHMVKPVDITKLQDLFERLSIPSSH